MKRFVCSLLALAIALSLSGCMEKQPEDYGYRVKTVKTTQEETTEDGAAIVTASYELPYLSIVDGKGNVLTSNVPEEMTAVQQTFGNRVDADVDALFSYADAVSQAKQDLADSHSNGYDFIAYEIDFTTNSVWEKENFVSAFVSGGVYLGGAHPWCLIRAWNFDLDRGEFVTWEDLTDEDDAMRAFLADQIFAQIDEQGLRDYFFDDMEPIVRKLEYTQTYFDKNGLNVLFEEESIGPHAAGIPTFSVPYDRLTPYLNERAVALLGLGETTAVAEPIPGEIVSAQGIEAYRAVLQEDGVFFNTDAGSELTIEELDKAVGYDTAITIKQFTVVDLDDDGKEEVVLALDAGFDGFFEVLHEQNGTVYGYTLVYRAMQALKQNGLLAFSSGALDSGIGRLRFGAAGYELLPLTYSQSGTDGAGSVSVAYYVDGAEAGEEAFRSAYDAFQSLPDAEWYAFNRENVEAVLR